jgi:hypothetical protein
LPFKPDSDVGWLAIYCRKVQSLRSNFQSFRFAYM